jgi:hypothetical protein
VSNGGTGSGSVASLPASCLQDEFYNRFLVRNNLFEPVIEVFLANGSRYNLLNSAVLELVDFVRKVRNAGVAPILTVFMSLTLVLTLNIILTITEVPTTVLNKCSMHPGANP